MRSTPPTCRRRSSCRRTRRHLFFVVAFHFALSVSLKIVRNHADLYCHLALVTATGPLRPDSQVGTRHDLPDAMPQHWQRACRLPSEDASQDRTGTSSVACRSSRCHVSSGCSCYSVQLPSSTLAGRTG